MARRKNPIPPPRTNRPSAIERLERLNGATLGRAIHAVVAEQLAVGARTLDADRVFAAVATHPLVLREPVVDRHSFKQRVITGVASYFRFFLPAEGWRLVGSEVAAGNCRFDLVWETGEGAIVVDEIKGGRLQTRPEREAVEEQVARELAAGKRKWHGRFLGIRLIWIGAPLHSSFVHRDGNREPLWEVE